MTTVTLPSSLITGIGELVTLDAAGGNGGGHHGSPDVTRLGVLHDVALVVEDGVIAWIGPAADAPAADTRLDLDGRAVIPGFVDSHTHLVFAGDRSG